MLKLGPLSRLVALAGLALATPVSVAPAFAAPADVQLLKSYIGEWRGRGQLIGAETETVVCRLTLSQGNQDKVNYSGRWALAGTNLSVNGTLAYNEGGRRYEAAMSTNAGFSGTAVGQKRGDGVTFNLRERNKDEAGNDMTITAAIGLSKAKITVDFSVLFNASGDTIKASVPFSK